MWQHRSIKTLVILVGLLVLGFIPRSPAVRDVVGQDFGITAFPATMEADVKPGESTRLLLQFKNQTNNFISGRIRVFDYIIVDKQGTPQLIESGTQQPKYGAASWVTPEVDRITIAPNDYAAINLRVTAPQQVQICGAYAAVVFESDTQATANQQAAGRNSASAITAQIGSLLSFRTGIPSCKEAAQIINAATPKFSEYGPIPLQFDVRNIGNVHISPKLSLQIKSWSGRVTAKKTLATRRIFPETAKTYSETIGRKWLFGPQTILLSGTYGLQELPITFSVTVWVFPWRLALAILLLIVILSLLMRRFTGGIIEHEHELEGEIDELKKKLSRRDE